VRIITAWQCILSEVIVEGFENCSISSAVDETDDDALWDEIEEDGNVKSWDVVLHSYIYMVLLSFQGGLRV